MPSDRLRAPLYLSVPKPPSRPPPLWQVAVPLRPAAAAGAAPEVRTPTTSAVLAGWSCVGIGLLTAWFFPLAHVFFSIAIILSIVAMATHQVRSGLLLLAGSLAGSGLCALIFLVGVATLVAGAFHAAAKARPEIKVAPRPMTTTHLATPIPGAASYTAPLTANTFGSSERTTNARPVAVEGQVSGDPQRPAPYFPAGGAAPAMPQTATTSASAPTPVDYQARDRQIQNLKSQIDALDERVRCIYANPRDYRYLGYYSSARSGGVDQAKLDAYLKELDRQRNDLRRQKWAMEGR